MYLVKLPSGEFINLALVERVEIDKSPLLVLVHWRTDSRSAYVHENAVAIIEAMSELATDKSHVTSAIAP